MRTNKNELLVALSETRGKYPLVEKVLVCPDFQMGHQILESLTRSGSSWTNFRVTTVSSLALEQAEEVVAAKGLHILSPNGTLAVVDSVFNALSDSGKLKYFEKHPVNKGIIEALSSTLRELRLNGMSAKHINSKSFLSPSKGKDLKALLSAYEDILQEKNFVDIAGLIILALESIEKGATDSGRKYFIPSSYCLFGAERTFLEKLCGANLVVLREDPVYGIEEPRFGWLRDDQKKPIVETDIERLKWLFESNKAPEVFKDGTISMFHALGCRNEIREVLRRIVSGKITVDDVEIIYTDRDGYADLTYSLCEKLQIPVTFADGIPAYMTGTGRALMALLLWIKNDFGEMYLRQAIDSGGLKWDALESEGLGRTALSYLLRTSGIGWGRERYSLILSKKIKEWEKVAGEKRKDGEENDAIYWEGQIKNLSVLKGFCEVLLERLPLQDKNGKVEFSALCAGLGSILEERIKINDENDALFVSVAKEQIKMLGALIEGSMDLEEALDKLLGLVSDVRVKASGPQPGHLYVSGCRGGGKSGRGNTFIVGFDEGQFPRKVRQDPILLDDEREKISDELELSEQRMAREIYNMAQLISGLRGKLTVSYSSFDIKEGRKAFPSSLVLQIFRIMEGKPAADYNNLFNYLGEPVGFGGGSKKGGQLDETEWWINRLAETAVLKESIPAVKRYYEGIEEGLKAGENRASQELTEYDGRVTSGGKDLDPRLNEQMIMSATRLETAAKCPFLYFIEDILGIRKPEETEKETFKWLSPMERGLLLHEVFQKFIDEIKDKKDTGGPEKEKKLLENVLDGIVEQYKETIPPPSDAIFQNEYLQLKRDINVFLHINRELQTKPFKCEMVFGSKGKNLVKVPLGGEKSILLKGKIDRIDKAGPSEYHVWDYKTGSSYSYEENKFVSGGEQVQHALYAVAAEQILRTEEKDKKAKVTSSGYLLPTEKGTKDGKGGVFKRSTDRVEVWQSAINKLLDLIGKGNFIPSPGGNCRFCDYEDICNGPAEKDRIKTKLENPDNKQLLSWQELKAMD